MYICPMKRLLSLILCCFVCTWALRPLPPAPETELEPLEMEDQALDSDTLSAADTIPTQVDSSEILQDLMENKCASEGIRRVMGCEKIEYQWQKLGQDAFAQGQNDQAREAFARAYDLADFHDNPSQKTKAAFWRLRLDLDTLQDPRELGRWAERVLALSPAQDSMGQKISAHLWNVLQILDPNYPLLDSLRKQWKCPSSQAVLKISCAQNSSEIASALQAKNLGPRDRAALLGALGQKSWLEKKYAEAYRAWEQKRELYQNSNTSNLDLLWGVELWHMGEYALKMENYEDAATYLNEALDWCQNTNWLPPERQYRLHMDLVRALQKSGQFSEASEILRQAVRLRQRSTLSPSLSETKD